MDGKGIFIWVDGRKYSGEYKDDKIHGKGKFEWPDGSQFNGNWAFGK